MINLSICKTALHKFFLQILVALALPFVAKADLGITVVTTQNGNEVTADFLVHNFEDIQSMQFTMQWNVAEMTYASTTNYNLPGMSTANFGVTQVQNGYLTLSWLDPSVGGISLPDCSSIFSVRYTANSSQIPPILINGTITVVEIIQSPNIEINLQQTLGCANAGQIAGNVFNDLNDNCLNDNGEPGLQGWKLQIEQNGNTYYRTTNSLGDYTFYGPPGDYDVSLVLPQNNLWTSCPLSQTVTVVEGGQAIADFAAQALAECPQLTVDLGSPFLRRCFNSTYYVKYNNEGTATADEAYIELTLDPYLSYVSSSIPFASQNGQTYTFPVGDVAVGLGGNFWVKVEVSCDAELGQTHCSEAYIFPDEICEPVNLLWDGSILDVTGTCDGDSVRFIITNNGADMAQPVPFIVIEDDMVNFEGLGIQLGSGESYAVAVPANGSTWRVELDDAGSNPFNGTTATSVEGCGVNSSGTFSLGFVTQFPQGDESPFVDTDCQANVGSYDPNDKTGYPNGFCAAHFIEPAQAIEYLIRFQNTGTDTAFNVVVTDTLPFLLDPTTVQPGASSHFYDFELLGNGVVQFTFPDIMLPDSNVNEPGSHGFVKFTVAQDANNPDGTLIANQAAIVFDLNAPVYTNTYLHTVATGYVQSAGTAGNLSIAGNVHTWYGAPLQDVEMTLTPSCPTYTDANGDYEFLQLDSADYLLKPLKHNKDEADGVTVLDGVFTKAIILSWPTTPILGPYQRMAADINDSKSITTFDIVLMNKIVNGSYLDDYPGISNWRFVDADYVFPSTSLLGIPNSISFDPLAANVQDADFIAVKPGDVIREDMVGSSLLKPHFFLQKSLLPNGQVQVELKANDYEEVMGFQFGLSWDATALSILSTLQGALSQVHSSIAVPGSIRLVYIAPSEAQSFPDGTTLFTMFFDVLAPNGDSAEVVLDETLMPFQVVVEDYKLAGATLENANVTISSIQEEMGDEAFWVNIVPNPVRMGDPISIEIKTENTQVLKFGLHDVNGRLEQAWEQEVQPGNNSFGLQPNLPRGAYFLKVSNENGEFKTAKLVVY